MAITLDTSLYSPFGNATTRTFNYTCGANAKLFVLGRAQWSGNLDAPNPTFNGNTMTKVASVPENSGGVNTELFYYTITGGVTASISVPVSSSASGLSVTASSYASPNYIFFDVSADYSFPFGVTNPAAPASLSSTPGLGVQFSHYYASGGLPTAYSDNPMHQNAQYNSTYQSFMQYGIYATTGTKNMGATVGAYYGGMVTALFKEMKSIPGIKKVAGIYYNYTLPEATLDSSKYHPASYPGNISESYTCSNSSGVLTVCALSYTNINGAITYGGKPLSLVAAINNGSQYVEMWHLLNPSTGTYTISIVNSGIYISAYACNIVPPAGIYTFDASATYIGNDLNPLTNITLAYPNECVVQMGFTLIDITNIVSTTGNFLINQYEPMNSYDFAQYQNFITAGAKQIGFMQTGYYSAGLISAAYKCTTSSLDAGGIKAVSGEPSTEIHSILEIEK